MDLENATLLISGVIAVIPSIFIIKKVLKSSWSLLLKVIYTIFYLIFAVILWYSVLGMIVMNLLANMEPFSSTTTPCFMLNKNNCAKRVGCEVGISIGGLGKDSFWCYNTSQTRLKLLN